jgi:small subunit ribosomal protein S5
LEESIVAEENAPEVTKAPVPTPAPQSQEGGYGERSRERGGRRRRDRDNQDDDSKRDDLVEKVVYINRSAKVVKGGRRFSFSALVVVGDRKGRVGIGLGKGAEVSDAIKKGGEFAKGQLQTVSLNNNTIPHQVVSSFGGAKVLLRPASPGTGLICGKTVRSVVESVGVKDLLSKSLGSKNAANVAKATLKALMQLRRREDIFKARGIEQRLKKAA